MQQKVKLTSPLQQQALQQLLLVCQWRGLENIANKEIHAMNLDLQIDIDRWPFLKRSFDAAVRKEVRKRSRIDAKEGTRKLVLLQLKKRFGRLPAAVTKRVNALSDAKAQKLALDIFDAKSIKDLFGDLRK